MILPCAFCFAAEAGKPTQSSAFLVLADALAVADNVVQEHTIKEVETLSRRTGVPVQTVNFSEISDDAYQLKDCNLKALRDMQTLEFQNTVGNWIETTKPDLGFTFSMAYGNVQSFNRQKSAGKHCAL